MEVHAHTHTVPIAIGRKKWTHYLWKFLMLFLAVFCGFLAENQREHMIEHQREKKYIVSLIEDLNTDISRISEYIRYREAKVKNADTLIHLLISREYIHAGSEIYFLFIQSMRGWAFNHLFHHRGQLSVYLRLLDVPVPGMYGPSADEK